MVIRRAGVWALSAIVFALTLEVSLRVEDRIRWDAPLVGLYSHDAMFVTDSMGWHPRPGARFEKWSINNFGFRGPDISREKPAGVLRVAVLGSSEAFGQAERAGSEFPRALERELNGRDPSRFEVVNAAIPGMPVARMPGYWDQWVRDFDFDVVVVYPSPSFYLAVEAPPDSFHVPPPAAAPRDASRLVADSRAVVNGFLPESVQAVLKRYVIWRAVREAPEGWVWTEVPPDRLALYSRHNTELVDALRADGVSVVLATHADAIERPLDDTERILLTGWRKFQPRAMPEVILDFEVAANQALVESGQRDGVTVVRLDELIPADRTLFSDDQHFTDAGAQAVAAALVDAVYSAAVSR